VNRVGVPERPFRAVIFDCDSTLSRLEGIDELARRRGVAEEIEALTDAAMRGEVLLESVYGRRLELVQPDRALLEWLGERYVASMVEGAAEVVAALRRLGKEVHIVSGGFVPAVARLAEALGLPGGCVHAVDIRFDAGGRYLGFAEESPLWRSGGKRVVASRIVERFGAAAAVGDGVTDLEMQGVVDTFIGFGGVVQRPAVRDGATVYVEDRSLAAVLPYLLTPDELARLT